MIRMLISMTLKPVVLFAITFLFSYSLWMACTQIAGKDTQNTAIKIPVRQNMVQILAEVQKKCNTPQNMFSAEAKLAQCETTLASSQDPTVQLNTALNKAVYLLEYGDEQQSVAILEELRNLIGNDKEAQRVLLQQLGTSYLRLAERNNCLMGHNEDACIMPIRGKGVHTDKSAAKKAAESFELLLNLTPESYDAQWLLNICYMTLGGYPDKVPKKWLIPNLDTPEYFVQPFTDMATDLNVMVNNRAGGSITDDFDNDGDLDLVTSAWDLSDPMHYFRNNGDGTFTDLSTESGLKACTGGLNIQQTDYNNDDFLDVFVLRGAWQGQSGPAGDQPNSLLRNNGDGTFTDVTIEAGMLSFHPTQTATWNDFNQDGWVDVFIGNETSDANAQHLSEFYINNKNGTFKNVAADWGLNIGLFVKGVTSGDYDNDGWPDLFLSTMSGQKVLLRNKGLVGDKVDFEDMTEKAGFSKETYRSFPTFFFDYDNDGWLDLFVCNYEFEKALSHYAAKEALHPSKDKAGKAFIYHNNRNGTFTNVSERLGLRNVVFSMGSNFGDINNDGWLDMYLATGNPSYRSLVPNKLFVNLEGKKFADATVSSRTGNLQKGHGVSFADLDNDGDQDIHVDLGGAFRGDAYPNALYVNPGQNNNRWIYLKLEGTKSNRAALGAKITVKFHENGKERMVYRELNSGGSFGSSPLRREIGIGQAEVVDEIIIQWPASGIKQVLKNVQPNQMIKIKEGQDGFQQVNLTRMTFRKADGTIPMCAPAK